MAEAPDEARVRVDASRDRLGRDVEELRDRLAPKALLRELTGGRVHSNGNAGNTGAAADRASGVVGVVTAAGVMTFARTGLRPLWAGALHARRSKKEGVPVRAAHVALYIAVAAVATAAEVAAYRAVDRWVATRTRRS